MDGNEQLRNALKAISHRPVSGLRDPGDDAAMRDAIADHFAAMQRNRRGYRRMIAVWAAAAAITLAGVVTLQVLKPAQRGSQTIIATAPGDVDGNGKVDILDALQLARNIESGGGGGGDNDINSDGVVDARDVDAIAMRAVSLQTNGGQAG